MRHSRFATITSSLVVTLAVLGAACSRTSSSDGGDAGGPGTLANRPQDQNVLEPNDPPKDGGKVVMAVTGETNGWNPALNQWADAGGFVGSSVLEPLMVFDAQGVVQPWLAQSIEPKTPGQFDTWIIK